MVLGLGRLDLSNIQNAQQTSQLNQQLTSNLQQQPNIQLAGQPDATSLLVQQQLQQQIQQQQLQQQQLQQQQLQQQQIQQQQLQQQQLQQQQLQQQQLQQQQLQQQQMQQQTQTNQLQQLQPTLPGYFISNNVTPIATNSIRPIVLDHNNNAINLASINMNQFGRTDEQLLSNEQLTDRIISPSTQSETSTNTQISKKIGIRVGSPPPEGQFKCWTLPRYIGVPFTQQQAATTRYTPQYVMSYNTQYPTLNQSMLSARKQFDAQQFASQILYSKQNERMNMDLESPQSNSQPDLIGAVGDQQSVTPTPNQQPFYNYYPAMQTHLEPSDLPDSYAKFCYETATHKYYTIPGRSLSE